MGQSPGLLPPADKEMKRENTEMENIQNPGPRPPSINLNKGGSYRLELIQMPRKRSWKRIRKPFKFIVDQLSGILQFTYRFYDRSSSLLMDLYTSGLLYVILTLLISAFTLCLTSYVLYSLREIRIEIRENKAFSDIVETRMVEHHQESTSSEISAHHIQGFIMPLEGARIPDRNSLLPNARREYRNGTHEGIDFFISYGTPVVAVKGGWVIHADGEGYQEPDKGFRDTLLKTSSRLPDTPRDIENILLGRYVILDHGIIDGQRVTTVYAHLDSIAEGVAIGSYVKQGELVGKVGNSGTSTAGTSEGAHLHFELRVNNTYLGKGLSTTAVRRLFSQILEDQGRDQIALIDKGR